ncbi:MAG: S-layer homology domain-containing protein [Coriobacteriia bacterium]|nr:S-layer homology domain-containing protein [Coriobacteriia bacterium]
MGTEDEPMLFIPFMERGIYDLGPDVAKLWMQERIPPRWRWFNPTEAAAHNADAAEDTTGMPDAASVSTWAHDSVAWSLDAGIISGKQVGDERFVAPASPVTRAEMAAIAVNAINGGVL